MSKATVHARIQLKNDTEANWERAINFVPLQGELIIYNCDEAHPFFRIKIGDGVRTVTELPFIDSNSISGKIIAADTTANWRARVGYIPNKGDVLIYLDKATINNVDIPGIKIGDGMAYGIDLPFIGDDIANQLTQHIADTVAHITTEERTFWNNKINCNDEVIDEILILHRN